MTENCLQNKRLQRSQTGALALINAHPTRNVVSAARALFACFPPVIGNLNCGDRRACSGVTACDLGIGPETAVRERSPEIGGAFISAYK